MSRLTSKPVSVLRTTDPVNGPKQALEIIHADKILERYQRILIKPNYVNNSDPSTGVTTDPRVVRGIVEYLLEHGWSNSEFAVGEGGMASFNTIETFQKVGLTDELKGYGVKLIDLNAEPHVEVKIEGGRSLKSVKVARSFTEYDCILSVPKLKVHCWSLSTLSMKNMMGGILPKGIMHDDLAQKIVDLNRAFGPELTVIDGILGCQRHELACDPIASNVIIAGEDFVATDAIGSFLMGLCPDDVPYLALAKKAGLGENDLDKIDYIGETISLLRKHYKM
ncbi:DUF362 domain-containing protein [Methanocella arvoryzae]|uniref:DUF362 domain-containing protein n=1 Tax=Methanocella arvoryzae (strain DSM 22066 / NBRC 105507 / MRE50) TaxID=351160 RepID=Q0W7R4_METAR|nr:conserved hypothetical protein [Methanocella arvoryzae MRE50]